MKLLLALFAVQIGLISATKEDCNVVSVNGKKFEKQVLKDSIYEPYQLSVDPQTNTLFFSYTIDVDYKTVQKISYLNLNNNEFGEVSGVKGAMATAVDTTNHIVYFGGSDGIYKYDYATKSATNVGVTNHNIWQMFYCPVHGLFFTTTVDEKPWVYKDGHANPFSELSSTRTRLIAVGEHHNIYFANSSGVFIYNHHKNEAVDLGDYAVNGFTSDSSRKLYFSSPIGFYSIKEKERQFEQLISFTGATSIWGGAFDKDDHIVYSNDDSIIKLVPTNKSC